MKELRLPTIVAVATILLLSIFSFSLRFTDGGETRTLKVSFLDVGQGDATLIESPSGVQVLIDGGKGGRVLAPLQKSLGYFDRDIDMVVATHPDMDHIGGLIDVLKQYNVQTVLLTENMSDTPVYEIFLNAVKNEGADIVYAKSGQVFDLGLGELGSTTLSILFPNYDVTNLESNMSSIVARLVYGESEYLLTGDSPQEIEEYLVDIGTSLQSDVLKVGHHGSRTSTSEPFLTAVTPSFAIISAGKDNSYGHPHKEVTNLLTKYGVTQKNTADEGSIVSESNGATIWFR